MLPEQNVPEDSREGELEALERQMKWSSLKHHSEASTCLQLQIEKVNASLLKHKFNTIKNYH